jgi:hypothetical protein
MSSDLGSTSTAVGEWVGSATGLSEASQSRPPAGADHTSTMTARIGDIVIDSQNPARAAQFWSAALGYRITASDTTGVAVAGPTTAPTLLFLASTDIKLHKNRIHFDICPTQGTTQDQEVYRLEALGATRLRVEADQDSWVVMADPDGNEFCVMATVLPHEPAPFHSGGSGPV